MNNRKSRSTGAVSAPNSSSDTAASWLSSVERAALTRRSTATALAVFAVEYTALLLLTGLAVARLPVALNLLFAVLAGLAIGVVFTIGHDACHQAFTPHRRLNDWLARLALVPSAHAASLWVLGHNRIHHRYTNLRGADYVWEPLSPAEYRAASPLRRWFYRLCRSRAGALPYYFVEMWWKKNFLPIAPEARREWRLHVFDSAFVVVAWAAFATAIAYAGLVLAPDRPIWQSLAVGWLVPFLVWNWLMGWIIFVHHTHPEVQWFADPQEWSRHGSQILGTVHARLPQPLDFVSNNIMEHNAHHAAPGIPLYHLRRAQSRLREAYPQVRYVYLTPAAYARAVDACKLFDPVRRCWTGFDGKPTGPVLGTAPARELAETRA